MRLEQLHQARGNKMVSFKGRQLLKLLELGCSRCAGEGDLLHVPEEAEF